MLVVCMHVAFTCMHLRVNRMSPNATQDTRVLVVCMLNQPAVHVESTCIPVSIECPKNDTSTCVLLMLCAETHMLEQHSKRNTCAPCAEFWDIRLTRDCM